MKQNNRGFTLVEVISSIALISLILLLASSIHIFGQKQYKHQLTHVENETEVRFAMKYITKEIRKANSIEVTNNVLTLNTKDIYKYKENTIYQNNNPIATNIKNFKVIKDRNKVDISIESIPDKYGERISLSTVIFIRN